MTEEKVVRRQFAAVVSGRRMLLGISQEELALNSGLHTETISRIEKRQSSPCFETLMKVAKGLDVCPKQLSNELIDRILQEQEQVDEF